MACLQAATASFVPNQDAMQLAMRFRAAKHALLRQLMKRYSDDQKSSARAACGTSSTVASTIGSDSMSISQLSHLAGGSRYIKQGVAPLMLLDPLLHTVKLCLQELSTSVIGRGTGVGRLSIHIARPISWHCRCRTRTSLACSPCRTTLGELHLQAMLTVACFQDYVLDAQGMCVAVVYAGKQGMAARAPCMHACMHAWR